MLDSQRWAELSIMGDNSDYPGQRNNYIKTHRYSILNFIPLTLYENFRIVANDYFLFILIICCLPYSPINWIFQLLPLGFVLLVSMVKNGVEDFLKYRVDKEVNSREYITFRNNSWENICSKDISVGSVIKITNDQMIPCDILYICSSNEDGICNYSEANLNGETAVKSMADLSIFSKLEFINNPADFTDWKIELNQPSRYLNSFYCRLTKGEEKFPASINNVLLRGMTLKYTDYIIGIVLATGSDTRVMMNARIPPSKLISFDISVNNAIILIFALMCLIVLAISGACTYYEANGSFEIIRSITPSTGICFLQSCLQYLIIFSYMIPISLMVMLEVLRFWIGSTINNDRDMVDEEMGHAVPHNSNMLVDLSNINYVLTDKTGTLTENKMNLVAFIDEKGKHTADEFKNSSIETRNESKEMLLSLLLNNSVIVYWKENEIEYNAESPDEAAFVKFAKDCKYILNARNPSSITAEINGETVKYEIIAQFAFTSARKRMTVVVRKSGESKLLVLTKGADTIVYSRCSKELYRETLNEYALEGYRTLVFAIKELNEEESEKFIDEYNRISLSMNDVDNRLLELADTIETDLKCIGVTAIEDKLQDGVPETIDWLRKALIRIWVLTGDKLETAIEIGRTSKVIPHESDVLILGNIEPDQAVGYMTGYLKEFTTFNDPVLVVTEDVLDYLITNESIPFMELASKCKSVIFARVSPFMKAKIVNLVRTTEKAVTLAVGDGANDVGMIQESNVGVGIFGREGTQAAQMADFAIPKFRHLQKLIGVHSHWALHRLSNVTMMMLYKNFVFECVLILCFCNNLASPSSFFDGFLMSCFNLIFSFIPVVSFGFFDKDNTEEDLIKYPQLHGTYKSPLLYSQLAYYIILGVVQAAILYLVIIYACPDISMIGCGTISFISLVLVVSLQIAMWTNEWNFIAIVANVGTILLLFGCLPLYGYLASSEFYGGVTEIYSNNTAWITMFLSVMIPLAISFLLDMIRRITNPTLGQLIHEDEHARSLDSVNEMMLDDL